MADQRMTDSGYDREDAYFHEKDAQLLAKRRAQLDAQRGRRSEALGEHVHQRRAAVEHAFARGEHRHVHLARELSRQDGIGRALDGDALVRAYVPTCNPMVACRLPAFLRLLECLRGVGTNRSRERVTAPRMNEPPEHARRCDHFFS
jgi:hypothetical protein